MAIFFALIFQVLFVLFAMVINVGLLVHHKINLQNSADLAAYYGAMKQAEMMNAIGHVNYQIRQGWKLLVWRYRVLGQGGDTINTPPYRHDLDKQLADADERPLDTLPAIVRDATVASNFCITYAPFLQVPENENICKDTLVRTQPRINLFRAPPVVAGFIGITGVARLFASNALARINELAKESGEMNWAMLARFVTSFNFDQADRKQLINHLARGLSKASDDFNELNGDSARIGVLNTLKKNLTIANRDSFAEAKFQLINGLGNEKCGAGTVSQFEPPKWLSEIKIVPAFFVLDNVPGGGNIQRKVILLTREVLPENRPKMDEEIQVLKDYVDPLAAPYNSSLGFEKNPWCMAYVGVSVESAPRIPFSPLGEVTMKAVAFAKPFGGRIGPWYNKIWDPSSPTSNRGDETDEIAPPRIQDVSNIADPTDPTRVPNYARYPGDQLGLMSRNSLGRYHRLLFDLKGSGRYTNNILNLSSLDPKNPQDTSPNFNYWGNIFKVFPENRALDSLSWDNTNNFWPRQRDLEILAVSPDLYDITYYSIEPDFYNNYYLQLKNEYLRKNPLQQFQLRPDFGARANEGPDKEKFSVKDQVSLLKKYGPSLEIDVVGGGVPQGLTYYIKEVTHVLTGWIGTDPQNYNLNPETFGKCQTPPRAGIPNPGDCVGGGRTGYSVKLVSMDYLHGQDLQLGGEGASPGPILNPPDLAP